MSLFDDDFYSTKAPRRMEWKLPGRGYSGGARVPAWIVPALGGALVTAVLFGVGSLFGGEETDVAPQQAIAVMAPPSGGSSGSGSAGAAIDAQKAFSDSVVSAAAKVSPTVVSIIGSKEATSGGRGGSGMGLGSGVMFSRYGEKVRIVTNNHVVEGFTKLDVVMITGEHRSAKLVGRDAITDLAVLEMDGKDITQLAEFGDSDGLKAGETAIAVGNPLGLGFAPTVTRGIISWPKRTIPVSLSGEGDYDWEMDVIQTDAAINQGNSGGALVNLEGKVVGINTLKVSDMGVEGLGFAIPINQAKTIVQTLITEQRVKRPYIGVVTQDLQGFSGGTESLKLPGDVKKGIIVLDAQGPAKDAGLKTSDVIVELDGKAVDSTLSLRKYIYGQKKVGDKMAITYYRAGKKNTVNVTLGEMKER
ncbi:S1C family serine protease [Paenibacillus silviterrae]|uniref:S1C family serine protease n=1 Tax=Paenibacillus silviterrae TaxID=3242194 RepID=UPI0025438E3B|nr:trypsin-like peptidase domain-containing protein [Paenibacillus chinjuensis]